jgi:predicted DNA binding CopG/RHH family protein
VNEEQKQQFYRDEYHGAPLREHMTFRCTSPLMRFIRTRAMEEGRDYSQVLRRLVTIAAELEGYNKNAC